uniref:RRM domain-containing protein n=1 Tax=Globodera rostochiensis TaxID=31243 RepID=A0A914H2R3_GLORO
MSRRGNNVEGKVYVGGLPEDATSEELDDVFHKFGRIRKIWTHATLRTQCVHWTELEFVGSKRVLSFQRAVLVAIGMTGVVVAVAAAATEAGVAVAAADIEAVEVEETATIQDLVHALVRHTSAVEVGAVLARVPVEEGNRTSREGSDEG